MYVLARDGTHFQIVYVCMCVSLAIQTITLVKVYADDCLQSVMNIHHEQQDINHRQFWIND